ncbi:MAG: hypothetical protein KDD70_07805 [Bdellovibrionales bacterium]|nr:hypothetical protein [Bdellovibrionales bacterium]
MEQYTNLEELLSSLHQDLQLLSPAKPTSERIDLSAFQELEQSLLEKSA